MDDEKQEEKRGRNRRIRNIIRSRRRGKEKNIMSSRRRTRRTICAGMKGVGGDQE